MSVINTATKEIHQKIVYYGPGLSGKTTNLQYIHAHVPSDSRGELLSISTESERTLFFDFLPVEVVRVQDYTLRLHLYTVPGQGLYEKTRAAVLVGAHGVVFVADAQRSRLRDNLSSMRELAENLNARGIRFHGFPLVLQYNKMDLPDALSVPVLDRYLNAMKVPRFEAVATEGKGVMETVRHVTTATVNRVIDTEEFKELSQENT